jgi:hypothetical protein
MDYLSGGAQTTTRLNLPTLIRARFRRSAFRLRFSFIHSDLDLLSALYRPNYIFVSLFISLSSHNTQQHVFLAFRRRGLCSRGAPSASVGKPSAGYLLVGKSFAASLHCVHMGKILTISQEEWDRIPPELSDETADQKRRRLVRQFLTLGDVGRLVRGDTCYLMTL